MVKTWHAILLGLGFAALASWGTYVLGEQAGRRSGAADMEAVQRRLFQEKLRGMLVFLNTADYARLQTFVKRELEVRR